MQNEDACAEYLASMCGELAELAKKHGFDAGAYLLALATVEFASLTRSEKSAFDHALTPSTTT